MGKKKTKNKRNSELKVIFFIILIAAALFIVSTYAWFSTQRNVSITNLNGTVEVAEGLEISLNAKTWANQLVLGTEDGQYNITDSSTDYGPYEGHHNISPSEMLPVSTLGESHLTNTTMTDLKMLRGKIENNIKLSSIETMDETITDSENTKFPGYFAFDIFLKNSSKSNTIEDVLQLNYDSSLQISENGDARTGLQNTVRVAFVKYGGKSGGEGVWLGTSDVNANQSTILKETGAVTGGDKVYITDVAIWEPNSNDHVEYIVNNNNRIKWTSADEAKYATKTLSDGNKGFDLTTQMPTYALADAAEGSTIEDIYDWTGTNSKTMKKQTVLQTTKTSESDYTVAEGVQNLISTSDSTGATPFAIAPNCVIRLRVYVWLEGQDVDCINYASHGGGVTLNIGLVKGSELGQPEVE